MSFIFDGRTGFVRDTHYYVCVYVNV